MTIPNVISFIFYTILSSIPIRLYEIWYSYPPHPHFSLWCKEEIEMYTKCFPSYAHLAYIHTSISEKEDEQTCT